MFVIDGGVYGVVAHLFRILYDRYPPKTIVFLGALAMIISCSLMGIFFLPIEKSNPLIIGSLVLPGIALGVQFGSGFAEAHCQATLNDFPDITATHMV